MNFYANYLNIIIALCGILVVIQCFIFQLFLLKVLCLTGFCVVSQASNRICGINQFSNIGNFPAHPPLTCSSQYKRFTVR